MSDVDNLSDSLSSLSIDSITPDVGREPANIIYTRVSSINQNTKNPVSIEMQLEVCKKVAGENALWVSEGKCSGFKGIQPTLEDMISQLVKGDTIYVYEINRLTRNLEKGLEIMTRLLELGVKCVGVNDDVILSEKPRHIKQFHEALIEAHYESYRMSFRAKQMIKKRKSSGLAIGRVPFGMKRVAGKNIPNDLEQNIIHKITEFKGRRMKDKLIASKLNREGLRNRGKPWKSSAIRYLADKHLTSH